MLADLHTHTTCSDGLLTPRELVLHARQKGIKVVAVTDHETSKGGLLAAACSPRDMLVVPGMEYSLCSEAHILVLGVQEQLVLQYRPLLEFLEWCKEQQYFTVLAHPFGKYAFMKFSATDSKEVLKLVDAVEVANGTAGPLCAYRTLLWATNLPKNKAWTAGSDAHVAAALGTAGLWLKELPRNFDELLDVLKKKEFSVKINKNPAAPFIFTSSSILQRMMRRPKAER
ncbi:MAG: PHP domain-containing protein [bacterium]|nr:PHP domain-containing protein [bacterium]